MKKKDILTLVILCSIIIVITFFFVSKSPQYEKFIVSNSEWEKIINDRIQDNNIKIDEISFNDYNLVTDDKNNKIYYSVVRTKNQFNPRIKYKSNIKDLKIAFKDRIEEKNIQNEETIEMIFYDKSSYCIYEIVVTNLPIINITYDGQLKKRMKAEIMLFDNHENSARRVTNSLANVTFIDDENYMINLKKYSVGHNKRKNDISIFGEKQGHVIVLKKQTIEQSDKHKIELLVNNQYQGIFILENGEK